jgi:2-(1,2-epoxy-1,2-dihydrophenyl)acetyl-CoA isomerase
VNVLSERDGAVATITLNRPDALNAYTRELLVELRDALAAAADPTVRAVVVTGAGRAWSTVLLSRLLGPARGWEWTAGGRRLDAAEALAWGLVSEVVPAAELAGRVAERAGWAAALPTAAVGAAKRLFDAAPTSTLADGLAREARAQAAAFPSDDHAEGHAAFRERREPRFSGR